MRPPGAVAVAVASFAWLAAWAPRPASAFNVFASEATVEETLAAAARWGVEPVEGYGLADGIQAAVHPSFAADLGAVEPLEFDLVREAVEVAFRAWENDALHFVIEHDSALAAIGPGVGAEIDVFTLPGDHPFFLGTPFFGLAEFAQVFVPDRLLTNGQRADGWVMTGGDVYLNATRLRETQEQFGIPVGLAAIALTRLLMHEIGHTLGFAHPTEGRSFDQDLDPLDVEVVDPLDPFAGLIESPAYDTGAIMSNEPCGEPFSELCPALFYQALRPDDRLGRDVLYPVPEPPSGTAGAALALAFLASSARRASSRGSRAR
jgi:hypothetical protein